AEVAPRQAAVVGGRDADVGAVHPLHARPAVGRAPLGAEHPPRPVRGAHLGAGIVIILSGNQTLHETRGDSRRPWIVPPGCVSSGRVRGDAPGGLALDVLLGGLDGALVASTS